MQRSVLIAVSLAILLMVGLWLLRPTSPDLADDDGESDSAVSASAAGRREARGAASRRSGRFDGSEGGDERFADRPAIAAAAQRARQGLEREPLAAADDSEPGTSGATTDPKARPQRRADSEIARAGSEAQERAEQQANQSPAGSVPGPKADTDDAHAPAISFGFNKTTAPDQAQAAGDNSPIIEHDVTVTEAGAHFGADARFAVPNPENFTGQSGSVVFWILPEWIGEADTNAGFAQWKTGTFENRIEIFKNGQYLRFLFCDNTGHESGGSTGISGWKVGDWHHVAAQWGDGVTTLFIDGLPLPSSEYNGELQVPNGTPWLFGSDVPNGAGSARSIMRDVQVYPRVLGPDEILNIVSRTRPPAITPTAK